MSFKDKIKKAKINSKVAYAILSLTILYFTMIVLKSLYVSTAGSVHEFPNTINGIISWIMDMTHFPPLGSLWINIPFLLFSAFNLFDVFKAVVPSASVLFICATFISDHKKLQANYTALTIQIEKESKQNGMRKTEEIRAVVESTIDEVAVANDANATPSLYKYWRRKVVISVGLATVAIIFGLK